MDSFEDVGDFSVPRNISLTLIKINQHSSVSQSIRNICNAPLSGAVQYSRINCIKHCLKTTKYWKKRSEATQTLRAGCNKAEPKHFRPAADPFPGARDGQNYNQLETVTTFTCKPSMVRIDACNFELSW